MLGFIIINIFLSLLLISLAIMNIDKHKHLALFESFAAGFCMAAAVCIIFLGS